MRFTLVVSALVLSFSCQVFGLEIIKNIRLSNVQCGKSVNLSGHVQAPIAIEVGAAEGTYVVHSPSVPMIDSTDYGNRWSRPVTKSRTVFARFSILLDGKDNGEAIEVHGDHSTAERICNTLAQIASSRDMTANLLVDPATEDSQGALVVRGLLMPGHFLDTPTN